MTNLSAGKGDRTIARPRIYATLLVLIGLGYAAPGLWLAVLGGSPYYVAAGLLAVAAGAMLWRGRSIGVWTYVALLALTLVWALAESGVDGWALMPRLLGPALFGLWMALPLFRRKVEHGDRPAWLAAGLSVTALLLIAAGLRPARLPEPGPVGPIRPVTAVLAADPAAADWPNYGNDPGNARFSPLTQINRETVSDLKPAWTFRLGLATGKTLIGVEVTPLKIGDGMYLCTGKNDLIRLDPETGRQVWRFEAHNDLAGLYASNCRGIAYYRSPTLAPTAPCAERILTATTDGRLLAVDTKDGLPCRDFGNNGQLDVKKGMGPIIPGYFSITSPPQIIGGKAVIGGNIADGQSTDEPSAVIRGYDAQTGAFAWAWDIGRPGIHTEPSEGQFYARGMPNSWAPMAADPKLGLVYVPTGNATPDFFGGHRTPAMDQYASSIVALDGATGSVRWSFQTTHHDLWDYDVASPPTLLDVQTPRGMVPAVLQGTKRGELFLLDRRTGRPLAAVEERAVPVSTVPGERSSPTQPFSVGLPNFAGPEPAEARMWGLTPFDQLWCRIKFRQADYRGTMTPIQLARPTVTFPGYLGGHEWGGVSVDRRRGIVLVNSNRVANYNRLLTRAEADRLGVRPFGNGEAGFVGREVAQQGTPYAADIRPFLSPLGVPCTQPPFGMLSAIDMKTRKLLWSRPFGTGRDSGPVGIASGIPLEMGVPNIGGSLVTDAGLTFIGATQDAYLRAIDTTTGRELWRARLPAGGQATPMTYWSAASGRQFVVIAAGGHGGIMSKTGDYIVAYALPRRSTGQ